MNISKNMEEDLKNDEFFFHYLMNSLKWLYLELYY